MIDDLATYARSLTHGEAVDIEKHPVAGLPTFILHPGEGKPSLSVIGQQWIVIESDSGLGWELDYTPQGIATAKLLIDHAVAGTLTRRSDGSTSLASKIVRWLSPRTGRPEHE